MSKDIKVSPEIQLMLSACFQLQGEAKTMDLDESFLYRLVRYHGIRPQFFDFLHQNQIEVGFKAQLGLDCQQRAIRNMLSVNELALLTETLKENNIACFAYKGSVWANWLYGQVGRREFGDIDLLVKKDSVQAVLKVFQALGYAPDPYRAYLLMKPEREQRFYRTDYHIPVENTEVAESSMVEVHWQIAYPRLAFNFPESEWATYRHVYTLHGKTIEAFSNEYQLLMLVVHHGGKEQWSRLKYIADFAAYLLRYGDQTDWQLVESLARQKGIYTLLMKSMDLMKALGLAWSDRWPYSTNRIDTAPYLKIWMQMPEQSENSTWPYFVEGLRIHDGVKHKSKVLLGHLAYFSEWRLLYDKMKWYRQNSN